MNQTEKVKEIVRNLQPCLVKKLNEKNLEFLLAFSEIDNTIIKEFVIHNFNADMRMNDMIDISFLVSYNGVFFSLNAVLNEYLEVLITNCMPDVGFLQSERACEILIELIVESEIMMNLLDIRLSAKEFRRLPQ